MKIAKQVPLAAVALATLLGASAAHAATYNMIITVAEGAGAFNSTLSGTEVQTFDNLLGRRDNVVWDGVGTFDHLNVINANQYGGAPSAGSPNGTPYAVEGIGQVTTTTLRLNEASSYFGLYWSAGDAANDLKFYSNGTLVADFTTANLMNNLGSAYFGNPIATGPWAGANRGEPYGFINFFGSEGTTWDTIVFGNNQSSGFEADNYTVRSEGWNPTLDGALPGKAVINIESDGGGTQTVNKINSLTTASGGELVLNVTNTKTGQSKTVNFAPAAPAAPAPPIGVVAAFVSAIAFKGLRRKKASA